MQIATRRSDGAIRWTQILLIWATLSGWLTAPGLAASKDDEFAAQYQRAGQLYAAKDYTAAIPALLAAYNLQPVPQLLFNIGQAYRRLEQWAPARVYFDMYRTLSPPTEPGPRAELDQLILDMKEREQAERRPEIREKTRTVLISEEKPLPRWLRPLGITGGVAGVGLLVAGGVLLGLDGTCAGSVPAPIVECPQLYNTKTTGVALTAAGAGIFITGAIAFGLSLRKPGRAQKRVLDDEKLQDPLMVPGQRPLLEPPPLGWNADGTPSEPPPAGYAPDGQAL